jgi:hypothetical protein
MMRNATMQGKKMALEEVEVEVEVEVEAEVEVKAEQLNNLMWALEQAVAVVEQLLMLLCTNHQRCVDELTSNQSRFEQDD